MNKAISALVAASLLLSAAPHSHAQLQTGEDYECNLENQIGEAAFGQSD